VSARAGEGSVRAVSRASRPANGPRGGECAGVREARWPRHGPELAQQGGALFLFLFTFNNSFHFCFFFFLHKII
jgi:hypothetical protein